MVLDKIALFYLVQRVGVRATLGPEYVENISSRSLKKPLTREN